MSDETSSDLLKSMNKFQIPEEVIKLGLDLVANGSSPGNEDYYLKHPTIPGVNLVYLKIVPPSDDTKGRVYLCKASKEHKVGTLTSETKNFPMKMYAGYRVYLAPEHLLSAMRVRDRSYDGGSMDVGLLMIKGRGVVTFSSS